MDQKQFDERIAEILYQLTQVKTVEDLLAAVRRGAEWALEAHRADIAEKAKREEARERFRRNV